MCRSVLASAGVALVVVILILLILPADVFWTPDEGGKFLQMYGMMSPNVPQPQVSYPSRVMDPDLHFYPAGTVYPCYAADGKVILGWKSLFPRITLFFYMIFGLHGLYILPGLCGILSAIAFGCVAEQLQHGSGALATIVISLMSPVLFYSVLFWEHTCALCCCGCALWLLMRIKSSSAAVLQGVTLLLAGTLCVVAIMLRLETLFFLVAMVLAGAVCLIARLRRISSPSVRSQPDPIVPTLVMGASVVVISLIMRWLCDSPVAGDPSYVSVVRLAAASLFKPETWKGSAELLAKIVVNNPDDFGVPLSAGWCHTVWLGVGLCVFSMMPVGSSRFPLWMMGCLMVAVVSWHVGAIPERYRAVHSILLPMPVALVAILPLFDKAGRSFKSMFLKMSIVLYLVFLLVGMLVTREQLGNVHGGPEWGLRYGLIAYPLLATAAVIRFLKFMQGTEGIQRQKVVVVCLAALLLAWSARCSLRGLHEIWQTKRDLHAVAARIEELKCPVVTDLWWLPAAITPTYLGKEIYCIASPDDLKEWVDRAGWRYRSFAYIGFSGLSREIVGRIPIITESCHESVSGMVMIYYGIWHREPSAPFEKSGTE